MREQVCIVLNEREAAKSKAAEALEKQLLANNITASRLVVDKNINNTVKDRCPNIVILDYLLGDYSTGLDVMSACQKIAPERRPKFIFYTDEPSVQVAVKSLLGGALNYLTLEDPQASFKIIQTINEVLSKLKQPDMPKRSIATLNDLECVSQNFETTCNQIKLAAKQYAPVIVLVGRPGTGLSALAEATLQLVKDSTLTFQFNCQTYIEDILEKIGLGKTWLATPRLGNGLSCLLDHYTIEHADILDYLLLHQSNIWPTATAQNSVLLVCSNSIEAARAWGNIKGAVIINVPTLKERAGDLGPLVLRFLKETESYTNKKVKLFSNEVINWLTQLDWPGEVRQLKAVVLGAAIDHDSTGLDIKTLLLERKTAWEKEQTQLSSHIDPLLAALTVQLCQGDLRRAAARLGSTVAEVIKILPQEALNG